MRLRLLAILAVTTALGLAGGASAGAAERAPVATAAVVPGEVVVRYRREADEAARARVQRETGVGAPRAFAPRTRVLRITDGESVAATVAELRARPEVATAAPNPIAHISGWTPPDPGGAGVTGGWTQLQWNFLADTGVNAPDAWQHLMNVGRPGGRGVVVAVLDTGVAYRDHGRFKRSPDFSRGDFVQGYDFVGRDRFPSDENGHGTHVASTIGEDTGNGVGLTGLAYGARIMPVRVLDRAGEGTSVAISAGIRYAARRGADVINLSFEFGTAVTRDQIPDILAALRYARRKNVLVVGASGNAAAPAVAYPARASQVLAVAATTQHGCQADYSNNGRELDIAAPGGGADADIPGDTRCRPLEPPGADIYQMTFDGSPRRFGLPGGYQGTSMAAPHVSATAALVIASGVVGAEPSPAAVEARLKATARPLGAPERYGAGLLDAAAATDPAR
jgi:serine protease